MAIITIACGAEEKRKDEALGPQTQSCYVPSGYVTRSPGTYNRRIVVFSILLTLLIYPAGLVHVFCYPV
jgi:hypothetical protein